jgi:hypothetical protein
MATGEVVSLDSSGDSPSEKSPTGWHQFWQKEKSAADKRLRDFTRQGNNVVARYLDERGAGGAHTGHEVPVRLNLFWRNVTTLQAMLYGNTPKIDVSREHQDPDDDIARVAAVLLQRMLQTDVEASGEDFPTALKAALQDRLLPGLGVCRVRYDFETDTGPDDKQEIVTNEVAPVDYIHWQDFLWGWGRTWSEIPWLGFRSWLTKDEATKRFGEKKAKNLQYKNQSPTGDNEDTQYSSSYTDSEQKNNVQKAEIWEFWCKKTYKVYWWSPGADIILDIVEDPLELGGFWPVPRPMMANLTTTIFCPAADYIFAQDLYCEIDVLQTRIAKITRAIKVVGVYDKSTGDSVGRMLKEGQENQLIPVDNWAMFQEKGGLAGTIGWFPVQDIVSVLQTLQEVQQTLIQQLYEITGMSDLLRGGNTDQYTSDGTNQLKAKFGSINIQALQDEFARFASDLEGLKAEVISKHFRPESIAQQANARYLPQADQDKILPALELLKSPDVQWRVDIRPESIAMIDYAQLKQERTEYLTAIATYLQSATSMAKEVPESLPLLLEFMKFGMVGFKGSDYMEGILDQAIDLAKKAPPKQDDKAQQQQQLMQAQMQMEMQKIQAKSQADMQSIQAKSQAELQKLQMEMQATQQEYQLKAQADVQKITADLKADLQVISSKLDAQLQTERAQSAYALAEATTTHRNTLVELGAEHQSNMALQEQAAEAAEEAAEGPETETEED